MCWLSGDKAPGRGPGNGVGADNLALEMERGTSGEARLLKLSRITIQLLYLLWYP